VGAGGSGGTGGAGGGAPVDAGGTDVPNDAPAPDVSSDAGEDTGGPQDSAPTPLDAPVVTCPMTINGALGPNDPTQVGRLSRINPTSVCGMAKTFPGTAADPSNPHIFNLYRFSNPSAGSVCFTFTLTYPTAGGGAADGGPADGPTDGGTADADTQDGAPADDGAADADQAEAGTADGGFADAGADGATTAGPANDRYLVAFSTYDPTNLASGYLGDVGPVLTSPQTMSVTVAAGSTIDVVVYAINIAAGGVGPYTLSCTAQ
jgi:hypothetical protein